MYNSAVASQKLQHLRTNLPKKPWENYCDHVKPVMQIQLITPATQLRSKKHFLTPLNPMELRVGQIKKYPYRETQLKIQIQIQT